jgi:hypothetical protein
VGSSPSMESRDARRFGEAWLTDLPYGNCFYIPAEKVRNRPKARPRRDSLWTGAAEYLNRPASPKAEGR